jgi:hypothetical protein
MKMDGKGNSRTVNLEDYRSDKRREIFIRRSVEKTVRVRDLLNESLCSVNGGTGIERRVVAFALNDLLSKLDEEDLNCFKNLLRKVKSGNL